MFDLDEFIKAPTQEGLLSITRDELLHVAGHYKVEVRGSIPKADLQVQLMDALHSSGVFGEVEKVTPELPTTPTRSSLDLRCLALREKELEWEQTKLCEQREQEREQREHELRVKQKEHEQALKLKELDIRSRQAGVPAHSDFDVARNISCSAVQ